MFKCSTNMRGAANNILFLFLALVLLTILHQCVGAAYIRISATFIMVLEVSFCSRHGATTEYTQRNDFLFLTYIPLWWKNQPWLAGVGGARPPPLSLLPWRIQSCSVRSCWQGRFIHSLYFISILYVLCGCNWLSSTNGIGAIMLANNGVSRIFFIFAVYCTV